MTRVVVVEDHPLYRQALVSLVGEVDGFEVVAEAADGVSGVAAAVEHQPDVVLMDLGLPDLSGIEATRQIRALLPSTAVLVLTMTEDEAAVSGAVRAGAAGYLVKGAEPEAIARALARGGRGRGRLRRPGGRRRALHGWAARPPSWPPRACRG